MVFVAEENVKLFWGEPRALDPALSCVGPSSSVNLAPPASLRRFPVLLRHSTSILCRPTSWLPRYSRSILRRPTSCPSNSSTDPRTIEDEHRAPEAVPARG